VNTQTTAIEYAETLSDVFAQAVSKFESQALKDDACGEGITPALMECLQYLYLHGESSLGGIAKALEISISAASQLVDRLVKKGAVSRREDEEDRRQIKVALTYCGETLVKDARTRKSAWFASVVGAMTEEERKAFVAGVEAFLRASLSGAKDLGWACAKCGIKHETFCVVNQLKTEKNMEKTSAQKPEDQACQRKEDHK